ncbi:hypothetical protein GCM10009840_20860 [Pseudolysinimonas kribbensis]|uniref:HNH nuclease domain-containing protein n=1 Tax=Pseudolysinimonas kribbensis TaxID=433641 RepID=A0ABQ6K0M0_9MICO|nr:HNH endonuclease signature motif containing protein [Pseudolysinimonas kribbensis]GMA93487.1 hypothetical protein GCM10025881_03110 [Pseudolysinimonas kribbensis]
MSPASLSDALRMALSVVECAPMEPLAAVGDEQLRALVALGASLRQAVERRAALIAGEVARRSSPELGLSGFAQRAGHRTVQEFLRAEAGMTGRDAAAVTRVGEITNVPGALGDALRDGRVSVAAADAIQAGLGSAGSGSAGQGSAGDSIPPDVIAQAVERLCEESATIDPDRLQKRARELRDELDAAGIVDRERARRAARSLRLVRQPDGMTRIVWLLDPESAAVVTQIYDRATSPRRGGPRFVEAGARERARRVVDDERSTEQLASDAFTELLRSSATIDRAVLLGGDEPAVRVLVRVADLASENPAGHGVLESGEAVGMATVARLACGGSEAVLFADDGRVLTLGRTQRLFTRRQRRALAARDGGCMWPGCERPPSWTEAHHIRPWAQGGRTDVDDGILLCRHHHLRLHDEGWRIRRIGGRYRLEAPPGSGRQSIMLETKSRAVRELLAG